MAWKRSAVTNHDNVTDAGVFVFCEQQDPDPIPHQTWRHPLASERSICGEITNLPASAQSPQERHRSILITHTTKEISPKPTATELCIAGSEHQYDSIPLLHLDPTCVLFTSDRKYSTENSGVALLTDYSQASALVLEASIKHTMRKTNKKREKHSQRGSLSKQVRGNSRKPGTRSQSVKRDLEFDFCELPTSPDQLTVPDARNIARDRPNESAETHLRDDFYAKEVFQNTWFLMNVFETD